MTPPHFWTRLLPRLGAEKLQQHTREKNEEKADGEIDQLRSSAKISSSNMQLGGVRGGACSFSCCTATAPPPPPPIWQLSRDPPPR